MTVRDTPDRQEAVQFFKYWDDLPETMNDLAEVMVYRTWPRIDLRLVDPDRKTIETKRFDGPIPFKPADYKDFFVRHFGSGEWRCILKERGISGKVIECYFGAKTTPLDEAPPKLDPRIVLQGEFENRSYIDWAHTQGVIFPWEQEDNAAQREQEESEDMQAEVIKAVTDQAKDNVQMAAHNARLEAQLDIERSKKQVADKGDQIAPALEVLATAAKESIKMVTQNAGKQWDPVELMKATAEFRKSEESGAQKSIETLATTFKEAVVEMRSMHKETLTFFGEQLTKVTEKISTAQATVTTTTVSKSIVEEYEEFKVKADLFGFRRNDEIVPISREPREEPSPQKSFAQSIVESLPQWAPIIQMVMIYGSNMLHNWAVARSGGGRAEPPQEAVQRAQQQAAQTQGTQNPQQPTDMRQLLIQIVDGQIFKTGFVNHFFTSECDGHTFAEFLNTEGTMAQATQNGRKVYLLLREVGLDNFKLLIRGNVDIWSKVGGLPQKVEQFLQEFFEYDEWLAGPDQEETPAGQAA